MTSLTFLARSRPYQPELHANEAICTRCGITYPTNNGRIKRTTCIDCKRWES